jgi:hypothetical protein
MSAHVFEKLENTDKQNEKIKIHTNPAARRKYCLHCDLHAYPSRCFFGAREVFSFLRQGVAM